MITHTHTPTCIYPSQFYPGSHTSHSLPFPSTLDATLPEVTYIHQFAVDHSDFSLFTIPQAEKLQASWDYDCHHHDRVNVYRDTQSSPIRCSLFLHFTLCCCFCCCDFVSLSYHRDTAPHTTRHESTKFSLVQNNLPINISKSKPPTLTPPPPPPPLLHSLPGFRQNMKNDPSRLFCLGNPSIGWMVLVPDHTILTVVISTPTVQLKDCC